MSDPMEIVLTGHTNALLAELEIKDRRINSLEAALREITEHPHCEDGRCDMKWRLSNDEYHGCMVGHRCCAEIARKALGES